MVKMLLLLSFLLQDEVEAEGERRAHWAKECVKSKVVPASVPNVFMPYV